MTTELVPATVAETLSARFPDAVLRVTTRAIQLRPEALVPVATFLRDDPAFSCEQLMHLTAVDWEDEFEVVYHAHSITHNHILSFRCRVADREQPELPTLSAVWKGAWLQELEVYDLMGIRFSGHPNLRRLFLWEGFAGWPLRKDFMQVEMGAFSPGLPHFPKQAGTEGVLNGPRWSSGDRGAEVPGEWSGARAAWGPTEVPNTSAPAESVAERLSER